MSFHSEPFKLSKEWIDVLSNVETFNGVIPYETFSRMALFHPELGYYKQDRLRVGKTEDSDFYTSTSHKEVFPELIASAVNSMIHENNFSIDTFLEVGAEPEQNQWINQELACGSAEVRRLNDPLEMTGSRVVYSNELFDAQPFQRWVSRDGKWVPVSLGLSEGRIRETLIERPLTDGEMPVLDMLPVAPDFDYFFDCSWDAKKMLGEILAGDWTGIFIAIDYGKTFQQLTNETPQGTARAYAKHQMVEPLFQCPGEQDLTTDVCWDFLEDELEKNGFSSIELKTQSRFLMENATQAIERIVKNEPGLTSRRKSQLLELISPGFFGQRFQVLTAIRK